jgi:hypothetical protein
MEQVDILKKETPKKKKKLKKVFKILTFSGFAILFFGLGALTFVLILRSNRITCETIQGVKDETSQEDEEYPELADDPIRSPLNGIILTDSEYEKLTERIPHVVMISNNKSARSEQYGLTYADIIYEAETEGGITRLMAIFWSNQEGYIIKPVRSVRKYFFDWVIEYGDIPVSFSGFAQTTNDETNSWGFYKKHNIRVTYFDWPFKWDEACLAIHPSMHCKRTTPEVLYELFDKYDWNYEDWRQTFKNSWEFSDEKVTNTEYEDVSEFSYDFARTDDWSSRWVYDESANVYAKFEPDDLHVDVNNNIQIQASTVILQKVRRIYTGDAEKRIIYKTVESGEAFVLKDGKKIPALWEKSCEECRTLFYEKLDEEEKGEIISFKPGLLWIAVVPSDKEIKWIK